MEETTIVEKITIWIGSVSSLVVHTVLFVISFAAALIGYIGWDTMLLVLTTVVSLEAIYLAIFIQMTVNRQTEELAEVSHDVDEIQEDIDEIQEDVDEIQDDIDDIQEDVEEISDVEDAQDHGQAVAIEILTKDVRRLLTRLEQLKEKERDTP